jgi:hypothetical protein
MTTPFKKYRKDGIAEKSHIQRLFKNIQMQGAQKTEPRGV